MFKLFGLAGLFGKRATIEEATTYVTSFNSPHVTTAAMVMYNTVADIANKEYSGLMLEVMNCLDVKLLCVYHSESEHFDTIDSLKLVDGEYWGVYSGKSFAHLKEQYPDAEISVGAWVYKRHCESYKQGVSEIDEARFTDMLEVLPPENWRTGYGYSVFCMSEYYTGNITSIFARVGSGESAKYYHLMNEAKMPLDEILGMIADYERDKDSGLGLGEGEGVAVGENSGETIGENVKISKGVSLSKK